METRFLAGLSSMVAVAGLAGIAVLPVAAGPNPGGANTNRLADADLARIAQVRQTGSNTVAVGLVTVNKQERTFTVPAKVNMVEGIIEYALVTTDGKSHESLLTTDAQPRDLHVAALLLGVQPSADPGNTNAALDVPRSAQVEIEVTWLVRGKVRRAALNTLVGILLDPTQPTPASGLETLKGGAWLYNGSKVVAGEFQAQTEGSIISLITDPSALINNPQPTRLNDDIHVPNKAALPPLNTTVQAVIRTVPRAAPRAMPSPATAPNAP
jgi:hypothetical protein